MKELKVVLIVLTLVFGSTSPQTKFAISTIIKGGPQTIHSLLTDNPVTVAVVGDYEYFLNCRKYKVYFEKIMEGKEPKKDEILPSCLEAKTIKTC